MNTTARHLSLVACAAALAACSSTPVAPPPAAPAPVAAAPAPSRAPAPSAQPAATPSSAIATVTLPDYLDPKSKIHNERSVYFDFDDYSIKPQFQSLVESHGKYLASHPALAIRVEGNADERGSKEYNLALGQKRAESVLHALEVFGVKPTQAEPVSWGEDKPKALGHDETAWAENRRADLVYPSR